MRFLRLSKKEYLWLLGILILYFIFRLPNLTYQPIFADEAIYIRWAQVIRAEPTLRFLPLTDGKTPLFMWLMIPFFKVFSDPLFAGRILSVFSGILTLAGAFLIGIKFFNKRVAFWAVFLLAITPFIVFFDRMALVDSMLAAFTVWSLALGLLLVKYQRIDLAMVLGYVIGGSILTKTPGFINIINLPLVLINFDWSTKNRDKRLLKIFGLFVLAILISFIIYNILRLGPGFTSLTSRNGDYVFSPTKLIENPLDPFIPHIKDLADWFIRLLGLPLTLLILYAIYLTAVKKSKTGIIILGWSLIPLMVELNFYRTFTARYVLSSIPPLVILAAFGLDNMVTKLSKVRWSYPGMVLVLLAYPLYFNFNLLANLNKVPLPQEERRGYLEDWTAGYGFKEIANFLDQKSKSGLVVVGTEGSFGTLPDGLQIYLDKNRQVIIIGGKATVSAQLRDAAKEHPTYFIANKSRYQVNSKAAQDLGLELIKEYPKLYNPGSKFPQDAILLFKVLEKVPTSSSIAKK